MDKNEFCKILKQRNAVQIDGFFIFNDLEVWNPDNNFKEQYKSIDELLNEEIQGETILSRIEKIESFPLFYDGGRGASSGSGAMGGGFNHARQGRGSGISEIKHPAEFNRANNSYANTLKSFSNKYANADKEYGVSVDELGYVHTHVAGDKTSVGISAKAKGHMILHNHPSGGNFSDSDLISTSMDAKAKGIVAVGKNGAYSLRKTSKFNAKGFIKAVKGAKWPTKYDYDKGADWWLKKNAKAYGYEYSLIK